MILPIISLQYYCAPTLLLYTSKIVVPCVLNILLQQYPALLIYMNIKFWNKPTYGIPGDTFKLKCR